MKRLLLIVLLFACKSSSDEKMHTQSVDTHNLAIEIGEHVSEKLQSIAVYAEQLGEPMKAILKDSVKVLTNDYAYWESTIIEVSGHEHHDHSNHDHSHVMAPDLTPDMMLEIQRDLRSRIVKLNSRIKRVLNTLEMDNPNAILK